jgi:hypothetical protein
MLMLRASLQKPSLPAQLLLQRRPTGVAQRSGAKSGAKRLDLSSNQHATTSNQLRPDVFTLKASSLSAPTQPLNSPNIPFMECQPGKQTGPVC